MDERDRVTTFRDDAKVVRCPQCSEPAATLLAGDTGKKIARCGAGHEWEPGGETVRLEGGRR